VEIFFGIITRQAIRRGSFDSANSSLRPAGSSTAGTTTANRSPGRRTPTPSSLRQDDHRRLKTARLRDTRGESVSLCVNSPNSHGSNSCVDSS
jgi:hypothetical protein